MVACIFQHLAYVRALCGALVIIHRQRRTVLHSERAEVGERAPERSGRILDKLRVWGMYTLRARHACHNALKWSAHRACQDGGMLKGRFVACDSLRRYVGQRSSHVAVCLAVARLLSWTRCFWAPFIWLCFRLCWVLTRLWLGSWVRSSGGCGEFAGLGVATSIKDGARAWLLVVADVLMGVGESTTCFTVDNRFF